ncbi:hypothetical protein [Paracidobacterium acidisoli]|uniref:Uncharacterized protein n=1 Tax=Paracidobacterium acidisoli TaxID=2303751 RepID=A0A372IPL7_9BACT|nr:hypothetical protein [Paracidobacterium acidisoli]MBT9330996.1 hypothetical protein [Paracidobacterium acidisoli]
MAVTEQTQDQKVANELLNAAMSFARVVLRRYGELGPFGFFMDNDRQVERAKLDIPRLPRDPERLYHLLGEYLVKEARRGSIKAAVMAANIALSQPSKEGYRDAVLLHIEQKNGYCTEAVIPYRIIGGQLRNLLPRRIAFGQIEATDARAKLFTS